MSFSLRLVVKIGTIKQDGQLHSVFVFCSLPCLILLFRLNPKLSACARFGVVCDAGARLVSLKLPKYVLSNFVVKPLIFLCFADFLRV